MPYAVVATDYGQLTTDFLGGSLQPSLCFILQGFIAKGHTGCFAAATADTLVRVYINRLLLIYYRVDSTHMHSVAIFTVVRANNVKHRFTPFHSFLIKFGFAPPRAPQLNTVKFNGAGKVRRENYLMTIHLTLQLLLRPEAFSPLTLGLLLLQGGGPLK